MFYLFYRIYGHFVFRSPQPPPWGRTTGAVRPEDYPHREGCVRDKQKAQKPTIAPGSGFQPPHYRLERKKNNRQLACPEREAVKA